MFRFYNDFAGTANTFSSIALILQYTFNTGIAIGIANRLSFNIGIGN